MRDVRKYGNGLVLALAIFILFISLSYWLNYDEPDSAGPISIGNMRTIVLVGDNNYPPFEYVDESGEYRGFDVDIVKAISLVEGFEVTFKPMSFASARKALANGEADGLVGITDTQMRSVLYDFSDPYIMMEQRLFVRSDNRYVLSLADLQNARVAVQSGDIANEFLSTDESLEIVSTHDQEEAFQLLLGGQVDAVVANQLTGQYIIQQMHQESAIKMVGTSFAPAGYGVAVENGNTELVQKFNHGLETIKSNGTYDQIYDHWFGEAIRTSVISQRTLAILLTILLFLLLLFVAVILWNRALAERVQLRTVDLTTLNARLAQINQELFQASNFKKVILDSVDTGIITTDLQQRVVSINRQAAFILGVQAEDWLRTNIYEVPPFSTLRVEDFFALSKCDSDLSSQERNVQILGQDRRLKLTGSIMFTPEMRRSGLILTFSDITEEWELRQLMQRKDKLQALGQIAAGIAHEIRNPLTAIKGFIQLLPYRINDTEFHQTLARYLPDEVDRLERIVNDMLDLTRRIPPEPHQWVISELVQNMLAPLMQNPSYDHISFRTDMLDYLTIHADQRQIKQVLLNIILNSIAAIDSQGEIIIRASHQNEDYSLIEIEDSGCGISEEKIPKIFDPFYTTKTEGTGLGLATSHQYVQENHGDIWVSSSLGEGTIVYISLPTHQLSN